MKFLQIMEFQGNAEDAEKALQHYIEKADGRSYAKKATICVDRDNPCLLYTSPSPRDLSTSRMPSSA